MAISGMCDCADLHLIGNDAICGLQLSHAQELLPTGGGRFAPSH